MPDKAEIWREIYRNIPENIDVGIYVLDRSGTLVYANSAMVRIAGLPKRSIMINAYDAYQQGLLDSYIFGEVVRTKQAIRRCQRVCPRSSPYDRPMLVTQTPVLDENSEVKYCIGLVQDVTYSAREFETLKDEAAGSWSAPPQKTAAASSFIFASSVMMELIRKVDQIAQRNATVLIQGESGTGKEVMAQYIHGQSPRKGRDLVAVNCAALPENLLEAELFGYEKGAFTGALKEGKPGLAELADGGTLFLDEIDSLPLSLQGKLLRLLESRQVRRLGGIKEKTVDFRLLAATNADLYRRVQDKQFRADLYYRLNVVPVVIPPLRERKEDIQPLCEAFLNRYEQKYGLRKSFGAEAYQTILDYDWPGNVRELKNFVERMVLLTDVTVPVIDHISPDLLADRTDHMFENPYTSGPADKTAAARFDGTYQQERPLKDAVRDYEKWLIHQAVQTHGSYSKAAKALGIDKSTLIRKLR